MPPEGQPQQPPTEGEAGLPPAPAPVPSEEPEESEAMESPEEYLDKAAGALDLLLNTPNLDAAVADVLVQVAEAVLAASKAGSPEESASELEGGLEALGAIDPATLPPDLKEVLDEVVEDLDEAIGLYRGTPEEEEGAEEGYAEGEGEQPTEGEACPVATQDIAVNLKNRQNAIDTAMYGPANPMEPGDFFEKIAATWGVPVEEAQTMRCGNCAVFIVTPKMIDCIKIGIAKGGTEQDAYDVVVNTELGYCEAFDFKCAASRTCRAWVAGGPVTEEMA
jgi:hypothetical protein